MVSMLIKKIDANDLAYCSELYADVFSSSPWLEKWDSAKAYERLKHFYDSKGFVGLLALEENKIKGFVLGNTEPYVDGNWFYLREMCIDKASQGEGMGTDLFKALKNLLKAKGVSNIYLATKRDTQATEFYKKNGFNHEYDMGFYYTLVE